MEILLVEDDDDHALLERRALEAHDGWNVHRVATMRDAVDLASDRSLDLAIIDHRLPDGDGLELLETLRAERPNLPVLFVTGAGSEDLALDAMRQGAVDYLTKGADLPDRLADRAQEVLTGWPGEDPLVQLADEEDQTSTTPAPARRPDREPPEKKELDLDGMDEAIEAIIDGPVQGALVVDRTGRTLAAELPSDIEPRELARVITRIHQAIGELRRHEELSPRRYGLVVDTSGHLLALSAAPGPLLVALLVNPSAGSMIGLRRAQDAARRIWEAA